MGKQNSADAGCVAAESAASAAGPSFATGSDYFTKEEMEQFQKPKTKKVRLTTDPPHHSLLLLAPPFPGVPHSRNQQNASAPCPTKSAYFWPDAVTRSVHQTPAWLPSNAL